MRVYYGSNDKPNFNRLVEVYTEPKRVSPCFKHLWQMDVGMSDFRDSKHCHKIIDSILLHASRECGVELDSGDLADNLANGYFMLENLGYEIIKLNEPVDVKTITSVTKYVNNYTPFAYIEDTVYGEFYFVRDNLAITYCVDIKGGRYEPLLCI